MEQKGGHVEITRLAVHGLFERSGKDRILGLTELEFFEALNEAQAKQDSAFGQTWLPAWLAHDVQKEHFLADPRLVTGDENLAACRLYISASLQHAWDEMSQLDTLDMSHIGSVEWGGPMPNELAVRDLVFTYLGDASHALQDSFSAAHVERDPTRPWDPTAPIIGINTFNYMEPEPVLPDPITERIDPDVTFGEALIPFRPWVSGRQETHVDDFDKPATSNAEDGTLYLERAAERSAAAANAAMLEAFISAVGIKEQADAYKQLANGVEPFLRGDNVKVFKDFHDPEFQKVLKLSYQNEVSTIEPNVSLPDGTVGYVAPPSSSTESARNVPIQPRSRPLSPGATQSELNMLLRDRGTQVLILQEQQARMEQVIDQQQRNIQKQMMDQQQKNMQKQMLDQQQKNMQKQMLDQQQKNIQKQMMDQQRNNIQKQMMDQQQRNMQKQILERQQLRMKTAAAFMTSSRQPASTALRYGVQPTGGVQPRKTHSKLGAPGRFGMPPRSGISVGKEPTNRIDGERSRPVGISRTGVSSSHPSGQDYSGNSLGTSIKLFPGFGGLKRPIPLTSIITAGGAETRIGTVLGLTPHTYTHTVAKPNIATIAGAKLAYKPVFKVQTKM